MTDDPRLQPKPVSSSAVCEQVYHVFPNDLNAQNTVFGGLVMALMDRYAAVVAQRHSQSVCVTVGVDAVHFLAPAVGGDTLIFNVAVNRAWRTSMEIGCRVEAEAVGRTERRRHRRRAPAPCSSAGDPGERGRKAPPRRSGAAPRQPPGACRSGEEAAPERSRAAASAAGLEHFRIRCMPDSKTMPWLH
jgi:acyl-CoA hydrolase